MISIGTGSAYYLRALVKDDAGTLIADATVSVELKAAYGSDLPGLGTIALAPIAGHTSDAVPYNYQALLAPIDPAQRLGRFYQAVTTIVRGGQTVRQVETVELIND